MTAFEIQLSDQKYLVQPQDNGNFRILENGREIGVIYPKAGDLAIEWSTKDNLEQEFVEKLGELIAEYQLSGSL